MAEIFACLYLVDEQGSRISGGEFYIDGEKLDSPYFRNDRGRDASNYCNVAGEKK